jgi:type II secretory pathway predicted ATPase ExeA/cell division septation protein DedD
MIQTALHAIGTPAAMPPRHEQGGSLTYEPHFGLQEKPFSLSADPRFLYKSRSHALAFSELAAAIRRREGLVVLTGEIGTGKTTLCRAVLESLDRRTFSAFVADPFLSREDLLKILLVEFGVVSLEDLNAGRLQGATRQDLSYRLYDFLNSLVPLQAFAVVVVDEAQNLSLPLLEELRILADLEWQERLIQVVLVGQPELRNRLKLPQLRQVEQRVSMRCELSALGRDDLAAYVDHRLSVARGSTSILRFAPGACDVVHHASAGVPRLINVICDRALHEAHVLGVTRRIESAIVWKAIGALGLGVTPEPAPIDHGTGVIELEPLIIPGVGAVEFQPPVAPVRMAPVPATDAVRAVGTDTAAAADVAPLFADDVAPARTADVVPVAEDVSGSSEETAPAGILPIKTRFDADSMSLFRSEKEDDADLPGPAIDPVNVRGRFRTIAASALMATVAAALVGSTWYVGDPMPWAGGATPMPELPAAPRPAAVGAAVPANEIDVARTPVEPTPSPASNAPAVAANSSNPYVVEVALFDSAARARRLVEALIAGGYPAYATDLTLGRQRFVQVVAGGFGSQTQAETALNAIRRMPGYSDARMRATN